MYVYFVGVCLCMCSHFWIYVVRKTIVSHENTKTSFFLFSCFDLIFLCFPSYRRMNNNRNFSSSSQSSRNNNSGGNRERRENNNSAGNGERRGNLFGQRGKFRLFQIVEVNYGYSSAYAYIVGSEPAEDGGNPHWYHVCYLDFDSETVLLPIDHIQDAVCDADKGAGPNLVHPN